MMDLKDDRRFHNLTQEQVETLDQVLTEVIPIHGRGNFPTLKIKPKDIIHVVRDRLVSKNIKVRDVRLNGSTASHVLVKENGTSYKDLDIIFGVELPKQEDFQIIKDVVLGCLLDFLPHGVNKDKITALTMKEAYVQKMVKVFTESDRWSLISLLNNSGKNVELKFVSSLRRQFEFSVDSFQIILDTMLESYLEAERREAVQLKEKEQEASMLMSTNCESTISPEQIIFASTDSCNETAVKLSDKTKDILHDVCHKDRVMIEDKYKLSTKEKKEIINVEKNKEFSESIAMTEAMENVSELPESTSVHINKIDEIHLSRNISLHLESKQASNEKNKNTVHDMQLQETKSGVNAQGYNESEHILAAYSDPVKPSSKNEHTHMLSEAMQTTDKNIEAIILSGQATFQLPSIDIPTQNISVDLNNEYSLPPPAKKNSRSPQMVVLKHSSPKPPRKMSRKVTCVPHFVGKSDLKHSTSFQLVSNPHSESDPKESMYMQVELAEHTRSSTKLNDTDSVLRILDISTTVFHVTNPQNCTHLDDMPSISSDKNVQTHMETETVQTTNNSLIPKTFTTQNGQSMKAIQAFPEILAESTPQLRPVIQINCQPVTEDSLSICSNPSSTQTADYSQKKLSEKVAHTVDASSDVPLVLSTNHNIGSSSPECSITRLLPQKPKVPDTQGQEQSILQPHLLEPIFIPQQAQDSCLIKKGFSKSSSISESKNEVYFVWPSNVSKSSDCSSGMSVSSKALIQTPETQEVMSAIVEPSVESPSVQPSISQPGVVETYTQLDKVNHAEDSNLPDSTCTKSPQPSDTRIPSIIVVAESMYGDFEQAMDHLRYKLIATRNPEEIRGGGLLKYSNLLVRDFKPASETEIKTLERYMCSRFFIDFPDVNEQQRKIESYLRNHFIGEEKSKYDYLMTLRRVVNESTVCLMGHERRQTLNMITILALKVLGEQNIIPNTNNVTCYYQPAPYMADHNFSSYYIANGHSSIIYHPYPLHVHMQTGLV